jgi:hypothetical protein
MLCVKHPAEQLIWRADTLFFLIVEEKVPHISVVLKSGTERRKVKGRM